MNRGLEFAWAEPADLAVIEAFHATHFGADSVQAIPGRVHWLYFANPLGLHVALCRDEGELVACCGHLPRPVAVGDHAVLAGFGIDFMVAPSHRRRGIGRVLLDMRLERFALSLSTGQSPGMADLYRVSGAVDLGPMFVGMRRRRPPWTGHPHALARGWGLWLAGLVGRRVAANPRPTTVAAAAAMAAEPNAAAWYRWRFGGPLYADHIHYAAGAVAACREDDGVRQVMGLSGDRSHRSALLAGLAGLAGAAETRVCGTGQQLRADLRQAGYVVRPTEARLVALTSDDTLRKSLVPGLIELDGAASDTDLMRRPRPSEPVASAD